MRVAVVHDAFVQGGGGERVAGQLVAALRAPLFTAAFRPEYLPPTVEAAAVRTTFVQPLVRRGARLTSVAALLPTAFARLDVGAPEVVVSSSSAFAHHVRVPPGGIHVCYCHTPPRFLWEPGDYFHGRTFQRTLLSPGLAGLRVMDRLAARRVDLYVANSRHVAARIRRVYGREALVVYPPVDTSAFRPGAERSGRFLVVSRLRNQKRVDLAVSAANMAGLPLDVVGEGPELERLRRMAGAAIRFLGRRSDAEVRELMARSAGVVVPAVQDFGLTLVEAQASGRPPIAFGQGGALEVVEDGVTGFLFDRQTPETLAATMERALREPLDLEVLVASARRFDVATFQAGIHSAIALALAQAEDAAPAWGRVAHEPSTAASRPLEHPEPSRVR